jgi:hypothetical protein
MNAVAMMLLEAVRTGDPESARRGGLYFLRCAGVALVYILGAIWHAISSWKRSLHAYGM